jgi:streptogramin lyase
MTLQAWLGRRAPAPLLATAALCNGCGGVGSVAPAPAVPVSSSSLLTSGAAPDVGRGVTYHGGPTLKKAQSIDVYVNPKTNPPDKLWNYPGKFIARFSTSKMGHIMDEYVHASQGDRYPYLKGIVVKHKTGTWTIADVEAILADAVNQTGDAGYGYIYHVFMVGGQQLCDHGTCIPRDNCAGHDYADLKIGKATKHVVYTIEPLEGQSKLCTTPSGKFQDAEAWALAGELAQAITDPDGNGWYNDKTHGEIASLCNGAWGDIVMNPGNVTYNITQEWLNSLNTCAFGPFGKITNFQVGSPGVQIYGIAGGPDGNVWFTYNDSSGTQIGRITPAGKVTLFRVNTPSGALLMPIMAGPDGNLWFVADHYMGSYQAIGRITTSGSVRLFTKGLQPNAGVFDIAAGNDGNMWFTEQNQQTPRVGRITPAGEITEFSIKATAPALAGITAGPDGKEWFTADFAGFVASITPHGTVTQYYLWQGSSPYDIATGADANVWFTCSVGIARFSGGKYRKYPVAQGALAITQGPDGALWFTSSSAIGRMTTLGETTILSTGTQQNAYLYDITPSLDGDVWYLDSNNGIIGSVSLSKGD